MAEVVPAAHSMAIHIAKPKSPIRMDWATCQSDSQDSIDQTNGNQRDAFITPPQKVNGIGIASMNDLPNMTNGTDASASKRVYDIPTLLKFRTSLAGIAVFAKIKPEALAENLFQYIGFNRPVRITTRSRGLSELSNLSRGSIYSNDPPHQSFQTKFAGQPNRQPFAPPENKTLQQHTGFARFLKQHASPPHHRVTAGGRIVPAGPLSPPPMFDYASLTGMIKDPSKTTHNQSRNEPQAMSNLRAVDGSFQTEPRTTVNGYPTLQNNRLQSIHNPLGNVPSINIGQIPQPSAMQIFQSPASLAPMGCFEDGSTMACCNGLYYRTYWNGFGMVIEPLQITPTQPVFQDFRAFNPQESFPTNRISPASSTLENQRPVAPLADTTNKSRISSAQSQASTNSNGVDSEHTKLKANLHELDKHLALHHYDLSQDDRIALVSRRKALVEQIDVIRRSKETVSQVIPVAIRARQPSKSSNSHHIPTTTSMQKSHDEKVEKPSNLQAIKTSTSRKQLSPAAPPFVPRSLTRPTSIRAAASKPATKSDKSIQTNTTFGAQLPFGAPENPAQLLAPKDVGDDDFYSHREDRSLDQDSSDLAMRIIHRSDIEYAQKYLHHRAEGEKRYCTSVSEFQEAVRRVREQARLYGCAGGSSKDPAYDAEQDIWWAICDRDPIPLPSEIPDHVVNPRPWDWNNSAFNHRREDPTPTKIEMPSMDLRDTSHLLSRNPAKPEKRVNTIDASRLSYAHHAKISFRPSLVKRGGDDGIKIPTPHLPTIQNAEMNTLSANLEDQEYTAVQKAIEVLNKRSKAIMAQANDYSTYPSLHARLESNGTGASRFQRALQNYTRAQETRDQSRSSPAITLEESQASNQIPAQASLKVTAATNSRNQPSLVLPCPEKHTLHHTDLFHQTQTAVKDSIAHQNMEAIPKRRSSARKSKSKTPLSSRPQSEKNKAFKIFEDVGADQIASMTTKQEIAEQARGSIEPASLRKRKKQLSPRKAAKKAKALFQKECAKTPQDVLAPVGQFESPVEPRVRLPNYTNAQTMGIGRTSSSSDAVEKLPTTSSKMKAFDTNEVKSVTVTGPASDTFLRDMLKSPRYSSNRAHITNKIHLKSHQVGIDPLLNQGDEGTQANKENTSTETTMRSNAGDSRTKSDAVSKDHHPSLLTSKAQSSLAASIYHASGYLPQYDGAGKAHTSTIHQQKGNQSSHRQARVNLPGHSSYSSYEDRPGSFGGKSQHAKQNTMSCYSENTSLSFGLDGSGDPPSKKQSSSSKTESRKVTYDQEAFDTMGVTAADFDQQRADTNNAWHHGQVNDLFDEIAEEEVEYMETRKRQNTKTA